MSRMWLRLGVSVAVLAALLYRVGLVEVLEICLRAQPGLLACAFLLYVAGQVVSALRWWALARGVGFSTPLRPCVRIYFVGMFFGLAVPSTLGADGARTLYLGREAPGQTRALSSVVFDRLVGLVSLVAVAVAALLLGPSGDLPAGLVTAVVTVGVVLVGAWLLAPPLARLLPDHTRLRRLIEDDLVPYFRDPRLLGAAVGLSLIVHALQIVTQKILTDALGLSVPLGFVAIYHPLVVLATAVPITIGGFGLREAAYAYLLPHAGIAPDDAVALALLWWAIGALGGLIGGVLYAGDRAARTPRSRSHDEPR